MLLPIADFAPSSSNSQSHVFTSCGACSSGRRLAATNLEDIGDGNGVLRGLALGGDDGDGRPGHGGCRGLPVVSIADAKKFERLGSNDQALWAPRVV